MNAIASQMVIWGQGIFCIYFVKDAQALCERCCAVERVMNDWEGLNNTETAAHCTAAESWGIELCSPHSRLSIIQPYQILNQAITSFLYHALSHAGVGGSLITMKNTFAQALNRPLAVDGKLQPHLSVLYFHSSRQVYTMSIVILCVTVRACIGVIGICYVSNARFVVVSCACFQCEIKRWAASASNVSGVEELTAAWQADTGSSTPGLMRQATPVHSHTLICLLF